jgi:general secretion pathway protein B
MSYILEALRKSQQERDLGQVPTLESAAAVSDTAAPRISYWGVSAVALAGLAVVIALYAALRDSPALQDESWTSVGSVPARPIDAPEGSPEPVAPNPISTGAEAEPAASAERRERQGLHAESSQTAAETVPAMPQPPPVPADAAPPTEPPVAAREEDGGIPEDLRQEIEAFKRQVRGEPAGAEEETPRQEVPVRELRLPREVRERLPALSMTVHIYDSDPAKRFVLINARKYREGEQTRQDVLVEEILPDGVVLSYDGHRFFRHR